MLDLLGLPLPLALEMLESTPVVVETAPPFAPKNRVPVWGEARVLRVRKRQGEVELLVAPELLSEGTPPTSPSKPI